MNFYRFISAGVGIYEAVEKSCRRDDLRRTNKPDGSWLPKVGGKFPGAVSFWKKTGLEKYLSSGLQEWHRSVIDEPLSVLVADSLDDIIYEDDLQVICSVAPNANEVSWDDFPKILNHYPLVEKVVAYISAPDRTNKLVVFEHDKQWSEAGIQVPAGTVDQGETIENALIREAQEESGLSNLKIVRKIDDYILFRCTHSQFNRRHVFLLSSADSLPDQWIHRVDGKGIDNGMNFHFYWMPFPVAESELTGSLGSSIRKIQGGLSDES